MNSRPWLAVAVKARAPVADAPIATDMAANSDSTLMNSQGVSSPGLHQRAERLDDVGLGRDRVGAHHLGPAPRHRLGDGARAFNLPEHRAPPCPSAVKANRACWNTSAAAATLRSATVPSRLNRSRMAVLSDAKRDLSGQCGEATQQRGVGQWPAELAPRCVGGRHREQALGGGTRPTSEPRPSASSGRDELIST